MTRRALVLALAAVSLWACGGGKKKKNTPPPEDQAAPAQTETAAAPGKKTEKLVVHGKIGDKDRAALQLKRDDFTPDATGDVHRDPFRNHNKVEEGSLTNLGTSPIPPIPKVNVPLADAQECARGVEAPDAELPELRLAGIGTRGTASFAMFVDSAKQDHTVRQGDCLGKQRARVKEIKEGVVLLEVPQPASETDPAPPPIVKSISLHPEDGVLELEVVDRPEPPKPVPKPGG